MPPIEQLKQEIRELLGKGEPPQLVEKVEILLNFTDDIQKMVDVKEWPNIRKRHRVIPAHDINSRRTTKDEE